MKERVVSLVLVVGLAVACRSGGVDTQPSEQAAKPVEPVRAVPATPIRAQPAAPSLQNEKPAAGPADSRAERLAALQKEQREAMNAYYEAYQAAMGDNDNPTLEELQKLQETVKQPDTQGYIARAQQLLDEDATDLTAFHTIQWLLDNSHTPGARPPLLALLEKHHMNRPEMGALCGRLAQDGRGLLEKLLANSPHEGVRGQACMALAEGMKRDIETAAYVKTASPQDLEGFKSYIGAEKLAALEQLDVAQAQREVETVYERVANEYGGVQLHAGTKRETTLGQQASAALFELRNLAVGRTAPEIEGTDLDQVAFKLSDYRGKVVLLDFWGHW